MNKLFLSLLAAILMMASAFKTAENEGYKVGDVVTDFTLKNIDGKMVSLANYKKAKGFIVLFKKEY
jgi:peroxiredoxin